MFFIKDLLIAESDKRLDAHSQLYRVVSVYKNNWGEARYDVEHVSSGRSYTGQNMIGFICYRRNTPVDLQKWVK